MVSLDIFSDPICPWCYIGKAYLDQALAEAPDHPFEIRWLPFQLNPDMPPEGMDRQAYLEAKFGGRDAAVQAYLPVAEHAQKAGLEINLEAISRTPSTIDAQRLIHWAGIEGRQIAVVSSLFTAYFVEGRDIGDSEVLADIADSTGMDAALIRRLLASGVDADTVQKQEEAARDMGVTAVPTFVVAGQHAVPGAQPPELWARVIDELRTGAQPEE